jgi:hypothetical protein
MKIFYLLISIFVLVFLSSFFSVILLSILLRSLSVQSYLTISIAAHPSWMNGTTWNWDQFVQEVVYVTVIISLLKNLSHQKQ